MSSERFIRRTLPTALRSWERGAAGRASSESRAPSPRKYLDPFAILRSWQRAAKCDPTGIEYIRSIR